MIVLAKRLSPILLILMALTAIDFSMLAESADARSRGGGRSFRRTAPARPPAQRQVQPNRTQSNRGSFTKGMMGGLLGGAIGCLRFGSLFGGMGLGGTGFGLLHILILGGIAFLIFRMFSKGKGGGSGAGLGGFSQQPQAYDHGSQYDFHGSPLEAGLAEIRQSEPDFDPEYFSEVAQDVFFKVQAGWMRREVDSFRHLLGEQLAKEYEGHFAELRQAGQLNKLENISVRQAEVVAAGIDNHEEFVTVHFRANLLDYTVDEASGDIVKGSDSEPVKFEEEWTWARRQGDSNWLLEGIKNDL